MVASKTIEVEQRYRIVRAGGVTSLVWEVTRVFMPWQGGFEPACIRGVDGLAENDDARDLSDSRQKVICARCLTGPIRDSSDFGRAYA